MTGRVLPAGLVALGLGLAGPLGLPAGAGFAANAAQASPDALAASASATLIDAAYRTAGEAAAMRKLEAALADAEAALTVRPDHQEARMQRALALAYRSKLTRDRDDARAARETFRAMVTERPRDARAWAALGSWHGEAVTNMGKFLAGSMLGAKTDSALEAFRRALLIAPNDPVIRTMYAINAIGLKQQDSPAEIRALLQPVVRSSGGGPLAEIMRANARTLLAVIDDPDALRRNAYDMRPFDRFV
ncbi:MAG: hypothetical protein V2J26_10890 [Pacificimonas sp.]|jgi:tetratricopeptide (TPR) repeat protein|nr:hypothetical protein [Pacificimonas sp.]